MKKKALRKIIYSILIGFLVIPQFLTPYATIVFSDDTKESSETITKSELDSSFLELEKTESPEVENDTTETVIDDTTTSISETPETLTTQSSASEESTTIESNSDINLMKSDNTPPVLESVEISSKEVNVGDALTIKAKVSDDLSGVTYASIDFKSPTQSRDNNINLKFNSVSGLWEGSYTIQEHDEEGEWSLDYVYVKDKIGNYQFYRQIDIETNLSYEVNNLSSDNTPPVLESVEISSKKVNVGDTLTIKAKVSDDLSGVSYASIDFKSPTRSRDNNINLKFNSVSGLWEGSYTIQEHDEEGKWSLDYVYVKDQIGNYQFYRQVDIETNLSYEVNNPSSDNTPPVLESVEISSKEVNVGDTLTIKAKVSDDLSGVTYASIDFKSPTQSRDNNINLKFNSVSGLWEGSYTIQEHDEEGEWSLDYVYVKDQIGNYQFYRQTEIETDLNYFIKSLNEDGSENKPLPYDIVNSNTTWSNKTINKDVYVGPNAVLDITGNVQINGNVYVYGAIRGYRGLRISGKLSAKQVIYSSSMSGTLYQGGVYLALGGGHSIPSTEVSNNAYPVPLDIDFEIIESSNELLISGRTLPFLDVYIDGNKVEVNQVGYFTKQLTTYKNTVTVIARDIFGYDKTEKIKLGIEEIVRKEETEKIPYESERKDDPTLLKGQEVIEQIGVQGEKKIIYEVKYVNEEEINRSIISEVIIKKSIKEIIKIGTREPKTGWVLDNNHWYYLLDNEVKTVGWSNINNQWYFFDSNGIMQTDWHFIDNEWYYMTSSGQMVTGWNLINNHWYYMTTSGNMQTDWQKINNRWYYLATTGEMRIGWLLLRDQWYYLDSDGEMQTGWLLLNNQWYYLNHSGVMQTGKQIINDIWYTFSNEGVMK